MRTSNRWLAATLLALSILYIVWFRNDRHLIASMLVFAAPPLLLSIPAWRGHRRSIFATGLIALLWFTHGVMTAWTYPTLRSFAFAELLLAVAIVLLVNGPGLRARFGNRQTSQ